MGRWRKPKGQGDRKLQVSDFELEAKGRWRSKSTQIVAIRHRGHELGELPLGPAQWAVLAALISETIDARSDEREELYQTKDDIADFLISVSSPFAYRDHIRGYVHELRAKLHAFLRDHLSESAPPGGWGEFLIPTHPLGYFIAVPAENLRRTILDRSQLRSPHSNRYPTENQLPD